MYSTTCTVLHVQYVTDPRHFLLLTPSSRELSATLRSRSMSLFLGSGEGVDTDLTSEMAGALAENLRRFRESGSSLYLMAAAGVLQKAGSWSDLRASEPWSLRSAVTWIQPPAETRAGAGDAMPGSDWRVARHT